MQRRWIFPSLRDATSSLLERELGVTGIVAALLSARGLVSAEEASLFLDPKLASLRPPEEIPGITRATERILAAIASGERITLYGDYDVDGVTSVTILTRYLRAAGAKAECFIPERAAEGYGLSTAGVSLSLIHI